MRIVIGTTSNQKRGYLEGVLNEIGIRGEIIAVDVRSGISEQPLTSSETKEGSVNRAALALELVPDADFSMGIEVGYFLNEEGKYEIFCWATILDKGGVVISQKSHGMLLPEFYQDLISKNLYLSDYVREYAKKTDEPAFQYLADIYIGRKLFITDAIRRALLLYLNKSEFGK